MVKHGSYYWLPLAESHLGKLREPENQSRTKMGRLTRADEELAYPNAAKGCIQA